MSNRVESYTHLASQTLRTGYYAALYRVSNSLAASLAPATGPVRVDRPVPRLWSLLQDVLALQSRDARNVRDGYYPSPAGEGGSLANHIEAVRLMFADLPRSAERRAEKRSQEAASLPQAEGLPDYYTQNFHFQTGGWLTEDSARVYDVQVETLFMGAAGAMRRQAIPPIADHLRGCDQRQVRLLDVACGSGRFLHQLAQAFPVMPMAGCDLSDAYLAEARRFLGERRNITLDRGNAEDLPYEAGSFDIATCVYLYHELPGEVRRRVTESVARVLKPGGIFVLVDSLQWGDTEAYDGLLEAFPQRFHEPYYLDYLTDKFEGPDGIMAGAGLTVLKSFPAFLSKVVVSRK